jgi:hypothetical protein
MNNFSVIAKPLKDESLCVRNIAITLEREAALERNYGNISLFCVER